MKPTDILSQEHRVIEQVLDCLEQIADRCDAQGTLNAQDAQDAISFLRTFADQCHHGKEEAHLFPAMEAKGFPRDSGPTGVMLYEHDQGRTFIRGMADVVEAAAHGDPAAQGQFVQHARGYIELLRQHIQKEDHCLFTMANRAFTEADQHALLDAFAKGEREHMGLGTHERYLRLANDLAARYGVAQATPAPVPGPACACGH